MMLRALSLIINLASVNHRSNGLVFVMKSYKNKADILQFSLGLF